jgi:hypothetical protein
MMTTRIPTMVKTSSLCWALVCWGSRWTGQGGLGACLLAPRNGSMSRVAQPPTSPDQLSYPFGEDQTTGTRPVSAKHPGPLARVAET